MQGQLLQERLLFALVVATGIVTDVRSVAATFVLMSQMVCDTGSWGIAQQEDIMDNGIDAEEARGTDVRE